jgi:hypothetical protein
MIIIFFFFFFILILITIIILKSLDNISHARKREIWRAEKIVSITGRTLSIILTYYIYMYVYTIIQINLLRVCLMSRLYIIFFTLFFSCSHFRAIDIAFNDICTIA